MAVLCHCFSEQFVGPLTLSFHNGPVVSAALLYLIGICHLDWRDHSAPQSCNTDCIIAVCLWDLQFGIHLLSLPTVADVGVFLPKDFNQALVDIRDRLIQDTQGGVLLLLAQLVNLTYPLCGYGHGSQNTGQPDFLVCWNRLHCVV